MLLRPGSSAGRLTQEYTNVIQPLMQGHAVTKTVRITRALNVTLARRARAEKKDFSEVWREAVVRGLRESEGIDMAGALHGIIGKYEGSGESQQSRMKRYGRARHR